MAFSATHAAFEGFRTMRRTPLSVGVWTIVLGLGLAMIAAAFLFWLAKSGMGMRNESTPGEVGSFIGGFLTVWLVGMVVMLLLNAILASAVYRSVLKPSERSFAYLRFGGVEVKMIGILLIMMFLVGTIYMGGLFGLFALLHAIPGLGLRILTGVLLGAAILCLLVFVLVRLSLVGPRLVATGEIDFVGTLRLTKGRFWPLLGMALLAWILATVIGTAGNVLLQLLGFVAAPDMTNSLMQAHMQGMMNGEPQKLLDVFGEMVREHWPLMCLMMLGGFVVISLEQVVMMAPLAAAYRDLSATDSAEPV